MSQEELDRREKERQEQFFRALKDASSRHDTKVVCKSCGKHTPEKDEYCSYCGKPRAQARTCVSCGVTAGPGSRNCWNCGEELTTKYHENNEAIRSQPQISGRNHYPKAESAEERAFNNFVNKLTRVAILLVVVFLFILIVGTALLTLAVSFELAAVMAFMAAVCVTIFIFVMYGVSYLLS